MSVSVCLLYVSTYNSPLPDDTHPVLDTSHSMRDLCEVLLAQSSLLGAEWAVLRRHNTQSVTRNRMSMFSIVRYLRCQNNSKLSVITELNYYKNMSVIPSRGMFYKYSTFIFGLSTYLPSRPMRYPGVLGSMRRGGTMTWAAAWAQSWW